MIYGDRLRLRAVEKEDLTHFVAWLNDPQVRAGLSLYQPLSTPQEEDWFERVLKQPSEEQPLAIDVRHGEGWKLVGNCGFGRIDWRNRSSEVGIFIGDKTYWNQGYGSDVMRLLLKHGFNTLNLHRIFLRVFSNNPRAIRAYEKAGFVQEGCMRQAEFRDGQWVDVILMSVLQPEWQEPET